MGYRNLDLEAFEYRVEGGMERFRVRVAGSPAGEQKLTDAEEVTVPPDLRNRLRRLERRSLGLVEMIALGESLSNLLFPPRARSFLVRSRERFDEGEGLRIRLRLDTYALADLPWEYAYIPRPDTPPDQKGLDGFLVLDRQISLVRYEVMGQAPGSLDPIGTGPLRLVTLMANPKEPRYRELKLDIEQRNIEQALEEVPDIRAEFYPDATVERLEDALTREAHVFHFAGHGHFEGTLGVAFRSQEGKGFIVLLDEGGRAFLFPAEKLAQNLRGRGVRLAVLGACEAGRRDQVNAWTGVAPALTRAGIPAVVGMQFTIQDENAIAFSRRFYRALAAGQPIDAAMTDGRLAIYNRSSEDERDWGVPVLYLRAEEGVLFPKPQAGRTVLQPSERSGGVNFYGRAEVHGDVAGRDMIIHGDEVRGDKVAGDKIEGHVGDVGPGAQVAIGKQIEQTIAQAPMELSTAERVELQRLLAELKNQLVKLDIPESKKVVGEEFVGQLEKELTKTDGPPDASMIKVSGNWLLENIPALAGTLVSVFASPVVGKVVEAAGDIAANWVKERFGGAN